MAKKILSIQVGNWWTRVALVEPRKKAPHVFDVFYVPTPAHAVEDGYIRDKDMLIKAIRVELGARQIVERDVIFTVNCSRIVTREITIPYIKDNKIATALETQAKDFFPMDISSYVVAHQKVGVIEENGKAKELKLLLVAMPDNLLNNYMDFAKAASFNVLSFDYTGNSAISLVRTCFHEPSIVVQFEEQTTMVSLIENQKLVFQRVAPYGYSSILNAVMECKVLGIKDEVEAFKFLIKNDVIHEDANVSDYRLKFAGSETELKAELEEAYQQLRDSLTYYIRVVSTALDYYHGQTQKEFEGTFHLIGDAASFKGLSDLFALEIPMEQYNEGYCDMPNPGVADLGADMMSLQNGIVAVIGAPVSPLDIMPKGEREKSDKKGDLKTAYTVLACSVGVSFILVLGGFVREFIAKTEQNKLQNQISQLDYINTIYNENEAALQTKNNFEDFDELTVADNERFADLVTSLENQLPTTCSVESLTVTDSEISISLVTDTKPSIAQLLINLKNISFIDNFSVDSITEAEDESGNTNWSFTVLCNYVDDSTADDQNEDATTSTTDAQ